MTDAAPPINATSAPSVFRVEGMTCQNCVRHVREAVAAIPEVGSVVVDREKGTAQILWKPGQEPSVDAVLRAVTDKGFPIIAVRDGAESPKSSAPWWNDWRTNVLFAGFAFLIHLAAKWFFDLDYNTGFRWFSFALATLVQILCGGRFYAGAWRQLKQGQSNMDTLVSLGSTAAYVYSVSLLFSGSSAHLYFKESIGIITFVSIGHWIESLVAQKASGALESLLALAPTTAIKLTANGEKLPVAIDALRPHDQIIVAPGEQIPADGTVDRGTSVCDESMLTGESAPIEKAPDVPVYAGTLNLSGELRIDVSDAGPNTALARIIAVVERAQNSRAAVQKLADRISSVFVPIVVVVAITTCFAWAFFPEQSRTLHSALSVWLWSPILPAGAWAAGVIHFAAVLIIACPCAMGLATPIAIMAGTNVAARNGVLIRDGQALERSGKVSHVLFDKTGTLTLGKPTLSDTQWLSDAPDRLQANLSMLHAIAEKSTHPLSLALCQSGHPANPSPEFAHWQEIPGKGITATPRHPADSHPWRLGSVSWLVAEGIDHRQAESFISTQRQLGSTLVGFSQDDQLLSVFALRDQLKPGAREMIQTLKQMQLGVGIISGDHPSAAQHIAAELGLTPETVQAQVSPAGKSAVIETLQQDGNTVCFVGDGINDAPALEKANLGIAVRSATDIAKESADLVLLQSDIQTIPKALRMAQGTLRTIKQNLFWAFFYNAIGIPLAALGFLSPLLCAAAMGLSDLVVIANALRLRFRQF